jgi:hypothetical protein
MRLGFGPKRDRTIEEALRELGLLLYGRNYAVHLRVYRLPFSPDAGVEQYIAQALGPAAVIGGSSRATEQEVLTAVNEALRHEGDDGYGPPRSALQSQKFEELVSMVRFHLDQALGAASVIERFWLKDGHPDYPVYWDFAFVIAGPRAAEVFVGSSSD